MYIEEIVDKLVGIGSWTITENVYFLETRDRGVLESFSTQIDRQVGFTEKQSALCLTILKKYQPSISKYLGRDIDIFLENPQFRIPKRVISQTKTVDIVDTDDVNVKKIRVSFPYNEALINDIKQYREKYQKTRFPGKFIFNAGHVEWNPTTRSWDFNLAEEHVDWIYEKFENLGFVFDQTFLNFVEDIKKIKNNIENYVPMVIFNNSQFEYKNTHKNIPAPSSNHLLEVLFEAKKYGIQTWDENIDAALNDLSINSFTHEFLKTEESQILLDSTKYQFFDLEDVIKFSKNIVVVIPGGSELHSLKTSYESLLTMGIKNEEMTVLFRLDSSAGKMCNEFVKEHHLNNPITDKIKIIFISIKVPKPLIASGKPIDAIINLGNNSAHYSVKNLLKNHHSVITCNLKPPRLERFNANV